MTYELENKLTFEKSHQACKKITKFHASYFHWLWFVLPEAKQKATRAVLAFRGHALEGVNNSHGAGELSRHLKECEETIERVFKHKRSDFIHEFEPALDQAALGYGLDQKYFLDLLDGLMMQKHFRAPQTEQDLQDFCYHVWGSTSALLGAVLSGRIEKSDLKSSESFGNLWALVTNPKLTGHKIWMSENLKHASLLPDILPRDGSHIFAHTALLTLKMKLKARSLV